MSHRHWERYSGFEPVDIRQVPWDTTLVKPGGRVKPGGNQHVFFPGWLRGLTLAFAGLSFALGVIALFSTSNDTGSAALLAVAVALLALGVFAERITTVEAAGVKLELLASKQLDEADIAEQAGRVEEAARLRESAAMLLAASGSVSSRIEDVRQRMPSSWERTEVLEQLMRQARELAPSVSSAEDVDHLFETGRDGNRMAAIAVMQARPEFARPTALAAGVMDSRSAFEQYQALRAIELALLRLPHDSQLRPELFSIVENAMRLNSDLQESSDRRTLAARILSSAS